MKNCVSCQKELPDQARFCSGCRAQQPISTPTAPPYQQSGPVQPPYQAPFQQNAQQLGYPPPAGYMPVRRKSNPLVWVLSSVLIICILAVGAWKLNLFPAVNEKIDAIVSDKDDAEKKDTDSTAVDDPDDSGFVDESGSPVEADAFGSPATEPDAAVNPPSADAPYIDQSVDKKELEQDLKAIEAAFSEGKLEAIEPLLHPQMQGQLMETFRKNENRLAEVSDLLKTRKPIILSDGYAEYQVEDNGKFYTAIFQKIEGRWVLTGL